MPVAKSKIIMSAVLLLSTASMTCGLAQAEALFDQISAKPFATGAMGFDRHAYRELPNGVRIPVVKSNESDPELQVPNLVVWPVFSSQPATQSNHSSTLPTPAAAAARHEKKQEKQTDPRIW